MNPAVGKRKFLEYWLLLIGLGLCALILAGLFMSPRPPKTKLWIRFQGLSTSGRGGWDSSVVVPKLKPYAAVIYWSVGFEKTNKASVAASSIVQGTTNTARVYGPGEEGIVACGYGPSWETGQVYRAIGYYNPGRDGLGAAFRVWTRHIPVIQRMWPEPMSIAVTSQWTEVTTLLEPF